MRTRMGEGQEKLLEEVAHSEDLLRRKAKLLNFPEPFESYFLNYYLEKFIPQMRIAIILGILLFSLFGVSDLFLFEDVKERLWAVRFGVFLPVAVVGALFIFLIRRERVLQLIQTTVAVYAGICLLWMTNIGGKERAVFPFIGFLLVIFYLCTFSAVRFAFAFAGTLVLNISYFVSEIAFSLSPERVFAMNCFYLFTADGLALPVSYFLEKHSRDDFLNRLLLSYEKKKIQELSLEDTLTGVANRRKFEEFLSREWERAKRLKRPLSLLMIDIDSFKKFNDRLGHLEGDRALKEVAQAIRRCVRDKMDLVARYGGEEFTVILPETDLNGAYKVAQRILRAVEDLNIKHPDSEVSDRLTVSVGVASLMPSDDSFNKEDLVKRADEALYRAKERGKNRAEKFTSV